MPAGWLRVRLGRAIALDPAILLLEHASARLAREEVVAVGADARVAWPPRDGSRWSRCRRTRRSPGRWPIACLTLEPATGRLKAQRRWFGRFGS